MKSETAGFFKTYKKHKRTEKPPEFSEYRKYKPYLKREFNNKCVYCRKSDALEDTAGFHVEHYRPKEKFRYLITDYSNLYYSCATCNRYKGVYWSDDTSKSIVNPCDYIMSQHLKFEGEKIDALSLPGETTANVLRLNNDESMTYRHIMQGLILSLLQTMGELDLRKKQQEMDNTLTILARLIGENVNTLKSALRIP